MFNKFYNNILKTKYSNTNLETETSKMILATKYHSFDQNLEATAFQLMVDCDMAILGVDQIKYKNYVNKVRQEFSLYNEEEWTKGRKNFLTRLLKRKSLYYSEEFKQRFEAQARQNLLDELNDTIKI